MSKVPQRKNNRYMDGSQLLKKGMESIGNVRLGKKSGNYKSLSLKEAFSKENVNKFLNTFKK